MKLFLSSLKEFLNIYSFYVNTLHKTKRYYQYYLKFIKNKYVVLTNFF